MHTYQCLLVVVQQNEEGAAAAAAVPAAAGTNGTLVASLSLMSPEALGNGESRRRDWVYRCG